MTSSRARRIAYYGFPMLFCGAVHWLGLKMWFFADDFAWLGLRLELHTSRDLFSILFSRRLRALSAR